MAKLVREMIGKPVRDVGGIEVGTLTDVVVDTYAGSLEEILVKPKGGGEIRSIPFKLVKAAEDFVLIEKGY